MIGSSLWIFSFEYWSWEVNSNQIICHPSISFSVDEGIESAKCVVKTTFTLVDCITHMYENIGLFNFLQISINWTPPSESDLLQSIDWSLFHTSRFHKKRMQKFYRWGPKYQHTQGESKFNYLHWRWYRKSTILASAFFCWILPPRSYVY